MKQPPPTRFLASEYRAYRPEYPSELFQELQRRLKPLKLHEPQSILDLGCGSGQSVESFLKYFPTVDSVTLVDPDPAMIFESRESLSGFKGKSKFINSPAETVSLADQRFDGVIIGSAFHWMKSDLVVHKVKECLNGFLFVFEYQFPRAVDHSHLNDWVRKKFNAEWKAPKQTPRGSFRELLIPLDQAFKRIPFHVTEWKTELDSEAFLGQIFSQSRYLHSEAELTEKEVFTRRLEIANELKFLWGAHDHLSFDFYLDAAAFLNT